MVQLSTLRDAGPDAWRLHEVHDGRQLDIARRAGRLLHSGRGVSKAYALAAIEEQAVYADELTRRGKRWYLA